MEAEKVSGVAYAIKDPVAFILSELGYRVFPGGSVVESVRPRQGAQVQSLVREPKS